MHTQSETMDAKIITDWSASNGADPYRAPELCGLYLQGQCDGRPILTSRVVEIMAPRLYRTKSGSLYRLDGPPAESYAAWCAEHGIALDTENPIVLKSVKVSK